MDHATRMGIAVASSFLLGAAAFVSCALVPAPLGVVLGGALLVASLMPAGYAAWEPRRSSTRLRALRERLDAALREGHYDARLPIVAARDDADEIQNAVARFVSGTNEPLQVLSTAAERMSQGDLTAELRTGQEGGAADLVDRFGRMRDSLRQLVGEVQANAMDVTSSAEELSAAIEEISSSIQEVTATIAQVSQGAQGQSEQVGQASHALRQTAEQLQRTAQEAKDAASRARQADESAAQGGQKAAEASRRIGEVTLRADQTAGMVRGFADNIGQISDFVKVIVRISDQTNLLALNAAIEAARAGEHGRGFTVVADEVRKLAEESAKGAEDAQRVIAHITAETNRIVATMQSTAEAVGAGDNVVREAIGRFEEITQQVSDISGLVARIAGSVDEMAHRSSEVAKNVESITATAEQTAASSEQVSAALEQQTASIQEVASTSQNLARSAAQALESVRRFRTGEAAPQSPAGARRPADMPPVFRPPGRPPPAPERKRVPLTRHGEEQAQGRKGG